MPKKEKHLEIILKIAERCNLNCSYCYFFNGQDQSYKHHPPYMSIDTAKSVSNFIEKACKDFDLTSITIDFHGGEPLLLKKDLFEEFCNIFKASIPTSVNLKFKIQTNGILITPKWIDLLKKHSVRIGISLDGTQELNDAFRKDFYDRGTYTGVVKGLKLVQEAGYHDVAILCVINPQANAQQIYRHFVDDLKVSNMDFLLPDITYDTIKDKVPQEYGEFLSKLFNEWFKDDNPEIFVRVLNSTVSLLLGKRSYLVTQLENAQESIAISIASNGDIFPDDVLRSTNQDIVHTGHSVMTISLKDLFQTDVFMKINNASRYTPFECEKCKWLAICGGGDLIHRFSNDNEFNNKSVLCEGLKIYYENVTSALIGAGIDQEKLRIMQA